MTLLGNDFVDPTNPFESVMITASAGSGKTYQLSRRFLSLVASGADPSSILCITFSKKAAAEMRERILRDAIIYGQPDSEMAKVIEFNLKQQSNAAVKAGRPSPQLRPNHEVSNLIVNQSQSLAITTIDGILMEWCTKFATETPVVYDDMKLKMPWSVMSKHESQQLEATAWRNVFRKLSKSVASQELAPGILKTLIESSPEGKLSQSWHKLSTLRSSDTFIWLAEQMRDSAELPYQCDDLPFPTDADIVTHIEGSLRNVLTHVSNKDKKSDGLEALESKSLQGLIKAKILKSDGTFHGQTISKKVRSLAEQDCQFVEQSVREYVNGQKLLALNAQAKLLWFFYKQWSHEFFSLKTKEGLAQFSDALKGVFYLFQAGFAGAKWLIQNKVKHLMLDEFQDTSRLQWRVFSELAKDVLSGVTTDSSALAGTVFVVGDPKQSIYAFRESAPEIMDMAKSDLTPHGLQDVVMSTSWRSAQIVLDAVNALFCDTSMIANFPLHQAAKIGEKYAVPNVGGVGLLPLITAVKKAKSKPEMDQSVSLDIQNEPVNSDSLGTESDLANDQDQDDKGPVEAQALQVSNYIRRCLDGLEPISIIDKDSNSFRVAQPKDFAVLYPKSTHAHILEKALLDHRIPCVREEKKGFFDRQEIKDAVSALRWTAWKSDSVALLTIIKSPFFSVPDQLIFAALTHSTKDSSKNELFGQSGSNIFEQLISSEQTVIKNSINTLLSCFQGVTPFAGFTKMLSETLALESYAQMFQNQEGLLACENLKQFLEILRCLESDGITDIYSTLQHLERMEIEDETGNASTASNCVKLMTIHKSKGLEFPVVFLMDTARDWYKEETSWVRSVKEGFEGFRYIGSKDDRPYNSPEFSQVLIDNENYQRGEKARVLYVAMTRAKQYLFATGFYKPTKLEPEISPDSYYKEIRQSIAKIGGKTDDTGLFVALTSAPIKVASIEGTSPPKTIVTNSDSDSKDEPTPKLRPEILILKRPQSSASEKESTQLNDLPTVKSEVKDVLDTSLSANLNNAPSETSGPIYGTAMHLALECHLRGLPLNDDYILSRINIGSPTAQSPTMNEASEIARTAIVDANSLILSECWRELMCDAAHVYPELSLGILSKSDLDFVFYQKRPDLVIERNDGKYIVVDYKTDLHLSDQELILTYRPQIQEYCEAIKAIFNQDEVDGYILQTRKQKLIGIQR
ncbi:MAG: UvrD-helicase domain-containing protein [Proteobacteria bacterium]|nr:UvrD-helicase domain-containing protein [Pseudomonadota bacterium]